MSGGDASKTVEIFLGGQCANITASLETALRDIRHATLKSQIWADAICINQQDVLERYQQLLTMGRIYSTAANTIIYLGPLTPDAAKVFQRISEEYDSGFNEAHIDEAPIWASQFIFTRP